LRPTATERVHSGAHTPRSRPTATERTWIRHHAPRHRQLVRGCAYV